MNNNEKSFTEDIIQEHISISEPDNKKGFQPWHKPRKQWIRENQWFPEIAALINDLEEINDDSFRYLTLPGSDFLDIRYISSKFNTISNLKEKSINFVGFLAGDEKVTNITLSESGVLDINNIDKSSVLIPDYFEELSSGQVRNQIFNTYRSFDAVNLDLTNSFLSTRQNKNGYASALKELFQYQNQNRLDPYILFITTRAANEDVDYNLFIDYFLPAIRKNAETSASFNKKLKENFEESCITNIQSVQPEKFPAFFGTGLCKWLIKMAETGGWNVCIKSAFKYKVYKIPGDMISIVVRIERNSISDPSGLSDHLSNIANSPEEKNEVSLALKALDIMLSSKNVDEIMKDDIVWQDMLEKTNLLLEPLGYNSKDFLTWANKYRTR